MSNHHYCTINHGDAITRKRTNIETREWELLVILRRPCPGGLGVILCRYVEPVGRDLLSLQAASEPHVVKRTKGFIVARQIGRPL